MPTPDHERATATEIYGRPRAYDAVVVGGGPAGLTAALHLSRAGTRVALVEEAAELGGQYFKRRHAGVRARYGDHRAEGTRLIAEVRGSGVDCLTDRLVWGVADDGRTLLTTSTVRPDHLALSAPAVVVATGAFERAVPFPGWLLPGVTTPGHALHLATCDVLSPGRRVVVAGSGPFLLPVACALLEVGSEVAAVVELNRPYRLRLDALSAVRHPARLRELTGYLARLARHRVPVKQGWRVAAATGTTRVEQVRLVRSSNWNDGDREQVIDGVDTLAVGFGFRPSSELLQLLGAACPVDPEGDQVPERDAFGRTSVPGVFAAGEAAGVAGVHAAQLRGRLAAAAVLDHLGLSPIDEHALRAELRRAAALDSFARLSARLYPVPREFLASVPDTTVVCRCESVTAATIREAASLGWNAQNSAKSFTRAGMGLCQGRECGPCVGALAGSGRQDPFPARTPIKPIPVAAAMGVFATEEELA